MDPNQPNQSNQANQQGRRDALTPEEEEAIKTLTQISAEQDAAQALLLMSQGHGEESLRAEHAYLERVSQAADREHRAQQAQANMDEAEHAYMRRAAKVSNFTNVVQAANQDIRSLCGGTFLPYPSQPQLSNQPMQQAQPGNLVPCPMGSLCQRTFTTIEAAQQHFATEHQNGQYYHLCICRACGEVFPSVEELRRHQKEGEHH